MGLLSRAAARELQIRAQPRRPPVWDKLAAYGKDRSGFQGIVLEPPGDMEEGPEEFTARVAAMVASFGTALTLPAAGTLILFDKSKDRELISHRISKTLRTRALFNFQADNPGDAYKLLQAYL
jgi:hypothetical protein